jgi:hypothetical protein
VVVVRLEDCLLSEQPGLLKEFFGSRSGYLPEGSAVYFGSLSHLQLRGIEHYAEEVVKNYKILSSMLAGGCSVAHVVSVPLGGVESEATVRDLYDLDAWLRSGLISTMASLPQSRTKFWNVIGRENPEPASNNTGERVMYMPESFTVSKKTRLVSGNIDGLLPAKIRPISPEGEAEIIKTLMQEISEESGIEVSSRPVLDRCSSDDVFTISDPDSMKVFIAGASHAARLVGGLAENGLNTINLTKPGLIFDETAVARLCQELKNLSAGPGDFLIIDPVSNSTFCGTDSKGNHVDPFKENGKWHIPGQLTIRAKSYIKQTLKNLTAVSEAVPDLKLLALLPLPRYVTEKCCLDPDHIINFGTDSYLGDISEELEVIGDLVRDWAHNKHNAAAAVVDYRTVLDDASADLDGQKIDGSALWAADDPVHGIPALYAAIGLCILANIDEMGGEVSEPHQKRPRLESVVVRSAKKADTQPGGRAQGWSSGVLPESKRGGGDRGGRGGLPGRGRGGRPYRGWPRFTRGWRFLRSRRPY